MPRSHHLLVIALLIASSVVVEVARAGTEAISFRNDVMAVFSKAGCNNGGCHGHAKGQGSLILSLRGEHPLNDYLALTENKSSRLLMPDEPERSLLLRKPTLQLGHEGGKRFEVGSPEYQVLFDWIAASTPADPADAPVLVELAVTPHEKVAIGIDQPVPLSVRARFSDGEERDVSRWAVYESSELICEIDADGIVTASQFGETTISVRYLHLQVPVRLAFVPPRPEFQWAAPTPMNPIDEAVFAKLQRLRMNPSERCDDATFIRRATLDLHGLLPSRAQAEVFVADTNPNKRDRLIESLLAQPEFAERWALKWSDLLRNEEKALDDEGVGRFHKWLCASFAANKPIDQFVRELVTGLGSTYTNPPANYYRALRNPTLRAEATAQLFLGTRLQCARCHRHPYEQWTQDDYYQFASVFDGMDYKIVKNERRDRLDKNQFIGEQIVQVGLERKLKDPRNGKPPQLAFLPIPGMTLPEKMSEDASLEALGSWLTAPDNPLFGKVQVNRVWFQLFGQGIVDPVDDFRSTNPPINPELLTVLEGEFIASGFDLRHLIRFITSSKTYQFSAVPNASNAEDEGNFSHTLVRRLEAETLLDAMHQVLDTKASFTGVDTPLRAGQLPGVESIHRNRKPKRDEHFLKLFGRPVRQLNSDLERSNATSLAQIFELTSGTTLHEMLTASGNRLERLAQARLDTESLVEELYWTALTRPPSPAERAGASGYLQVQPHALRGALEDLAWALINSKEFLLRR